MTSLILKKLPTTIKKGDIVQLISGFEGQIIKYSSNSDITLSATKEFIVDNESLIPVGGIMNKVKKEYIVKVNGEDLITTTNTPLPLSKMTGVSSSSNKFEFKNIGGVKETIEIHALGIIYSINQPNLIETWIISIAEEVDLVKIKPKGEPEQKVVTKLRDGSGPKNWMNMEKVIEGLRNKSIQTSEQFHEALIQNEVTMFCLKSTKKTVK